MDDLIWPNHCNINSSMFKPTMILTVFAFVLVMLGALDARAIDQVVTIKGEHISQIFAASCQENTFAEFQSWALRNHFTLRQFDSPTFQISPNEVKDDELLFSVTINDQNKWQATIRDQKFIGEDPCETAMSYLVTREPKLTKDHSHQKPSLSQHLVRFLLPEARAEKLVNETTTINWLLGALATASITNGKFIENLAAKLSLSNSFLLIAALRATEIANQVAAPTNLETLLTKAPELICSHNRTKIFGATAAHIIVKKGYVPYRLGFEDNKTEKPLKNESQILASGKVHDQLVSLAQRCNSEADAAAINAQLQQEKDFLSMKISKASELERSISSVTNKD